MLTLCRRILLGGLLITVIVVASSASAPGPRIMPVSNEDAESSSAPTPPIEQQLQIKQLQQETSWEGRLQGFLPAGSALAALVGAGWGVFVYLRDQRRNLQLRTQMEIASNLNRLIEHDKGEAIKSAQIVSALTALNALADQSANKGRLLQEVTSIITAAVRDDIDFNDVSQVRFEMLCLENWVSYEAHLRINPDEHGYILYRYLSALHQLHGEYSTYISKVNWNARTMKFTHPAGTLLPEHDFQLFQRLIQGIRSHLQLIDDQSRRTELMQEFKAVTGNQELTQQLLGGPQS
jgi:hypothetical protein